MKKIFTLLLSILMLALTIVPMAGAVGVAGQETPEYEITVVGADNIAALQKAGVLRNKESQSVIAEEPEDGPLYEITVSGAENIAAYKAAGIIRECATTRAGMPRDVEMAARAPSKVWNLYDQGCRATSYSMSTWIYSAYLYDSGDYSDIQHTIYPDQVQSISIQCYKANGTKWGGPSEQEDSDEEFAYIIKTGKGVEVYFKYTSMNGKLISGDMNVC